MVPAAKYKNRDSYLLEKNSFCLIFYLLMKPQPPFLQHAASRNRRRLQRPALLKFRDSIASSDASLTSSKFTAEPGPVLSNYSLCNFIQALRPRDHRKSQFSAEAIFSAGATVNGSALLVFPDKLHQQIWLEFKLVFFSRRCQGVAAPVVKFTRAEK